MLDVCLILLLEASSNVSNPEWDLQAKATAWAISDKRFTDRVKLSNGIAVMAIEWGLEPKVAVPWVTVYDATSAKNFEFELVNYPRQMTGPPSLGNALYAAFEEFRLAPHCQTRVVDISTKSNTNVGNEPKPAVELLRSINAQVNALTVNEQAGEYLRNLVPGFVMPSSWYNYNVSIDMKINLETRLDLYREIFVEYFPYGGVVPWGFVGPANTTTTYDSTTGTYSSVPEPNSSWILALGWLFLILCNQTTRRK
jgi:hypothetical protein